MKKQRAAPVRKSLPVFRKAQFFRQRYLCRSNVSHLGMQRRWRNSAECRRRSDQDCNWCQMFSLVL